MVSGHLNHAPDVLFSDSIPEHLCSRVADRFALVRSSRPWAVSLLVGLTESSELKELKDSLGSSAGSSVWHEAEGFVCSWGGTLREGTENVLVWSSTVRGVLYGAYAVLEVLGAPILHPLRRSAEAVKAAWENWPVPPKTLWMSQPSWKVCMGAYFVDAF